MRAELASRLALGVACAALGVALWANRTPSGPISAAREDLQAVVTLLSARSADELELRAPPYSEGDADILESYLLKLRREGASSTAGMRRQIDRLTNHIIAIETLLDLCASRSKSAEFRTEATRFKLYATAWQQRWSAVNESFMAGGNLPVALAQYPDKLALAIEDELRSVN